MKESIRDFIEINDLNYEVIDDVINDFKILAEDGIIFSFVLHEEEVIIIKYNSEKDNKFGETTHEYFNFKTLSSALEQLKYYDEQIPRKYYETTLNSIEIGFNKIGYDEKWYEKLDINVENLSIIEDEQYKYLVYENDKLYPKMIDSAYTLHEVSYLNSHINIDVNKLYFEIHPICCLSGKYNLKLLKNNEVVLKEYINYITYGKKGLGKLISDIFKVC